MAAPVSINGRRWLFDHTPSVSEPTGMAPIELYDEAIVTSTGDTYICLDATPNALSWLILAGGSPINFSPTIVGNTQAGTATYQVQLGQYQKIGIARLATISLQWTGHTGTGAMSIGNLPFIPKNDIIQKFACYPQSISLPLLTLSTSVKTNSVSGRLDVMGMIANAVDSAVQMSSVGIINFTMMCIT